MLRLVYTALEPLQTQHMLLSGFHHYRCPSRQQAPRKAVPPANVASMREHWNTEAQAPQTWPRVYPPPSKCPWRSQQLETLEMVGLAYGNPQVVYASTTMAIPKGIYFRLVADDRVVNQEVEALRWPHPNLGYATECSKERIIFASLKLLQGFGRCLWMRRVRRLSPW